MPLVSAVLVGLAPVVADGTNPADYRSSLTAALCRFGLLIIAAVAWAVLRAVPDRRLARRREPGTGRPGQNGRD